MPLASWFLRNGPTGFGYNSTAEEVTEGLNLAGRHILVTGCNSGIGLETARVLALRGAHVLGAARTVQKASEALLGFPGTFTPLACELAKPDSVRACAEAVNNHGVKLDAIICNAGIMAKPKLEQAYGLELQFLTNHIGHFLLLTGLIDALAERARVVLVSSSAHEMAPRGGIQFDNLSGQKGYRPWTAYGQSKFANLLLAKQLARRFEGTHRAAYAVHPGVIRTNLGRDSLPAKLGYAVAAPFFLKSIPQGAATQVFAAVHPAAATMSGEYLASCNIAKHRRDGDDPALAERLWEESLRIAANLGAKSGS